MNEEWLKEAERLADAYAKRRATVTQLLVVNSENGLAQFARVSEDVARSALMSHLARAAVPAVMPHDFITHKEAWREALRHCAERADTGEDAIARCSYCGRYSLDRKTLGEDRYQPMCDCGKKTGWSGSFTRPGPDATWSGDAPAGVKTVDGGQR